MQVEVILLQSVPRLGAVGNIVKVARGYANNWLIPQKMAVRATADAKSKYEQSLQEIAAQDLSNKLAAQEVAVKMDNYVIVCVREASERRHLYGSIKPGDIAAELNAAGFAVNKNQVKVLDVIKELGVYKAKVKLHGEVEVTVLVNVVANPDDAGRQMDEYKTLNS